MPMTQLASPSAAKASMHPPIPDISSHRCCRRHRRNSDITAESLLSRHTTLTAVSSANGNDKPVSQRANGANCRRQATFSSFSHQCQDLVDDSKEVLSGESLVPIGSADSLSVERNSGGQHHGLSRKHSVPLQRSSTPDGNGEPSDDITDKDSGEPSNISSSKDAHCAAMRTVGASFIEAIKGNTHDEPMSSAKALRIFNTVFPAMRKQQEQCYLRAGALMPEHDPSCGQCVSEAMATAHQAAVAKGIDSLGSGHSELRMNFGDGRNAVYVAPCERHLECPLEKKGKYLIHTNRPRIMTDMSKVEFGIRVDGWKRVAFKTVNDSALAERELSFYKKAAVSNSDHIMHLLDEFADNSNKHVMVFPRMCNAHIHGHDLYKIAHIARQLFLALEDLHRLGIAHLDITPTNLMADPDNASRIEVIDFGLACDIAESEDGLLPSRGTCGFVAPEILAGDARDLRADVYSAGVVLGMMLQSYLPTVSLRLLGGPLIRSDTTDLIVSQIDELLDAYKYVPAPAEFVECNTTYVKPAACDIQPAMPTAPLSLSRVSSTDTSSVTSAVSVLGSLPPTRRMTQARGDVCYRNSRNYSDDDDEAAAYAAAYVGGGASMYGGYGSISDDDNDNDVNAGSHRSNGFGSFFSRQSIINSCSSRGRGDGDQPNIENTEAEPSHLQSESFNGRYGRPIYASASASATCFEDDYASLSGSHYRSPNSTPVYARSLHGISSSGRASGLTGLFGNMPDSHSSIRYKPVATTYPRNAAPKAVGLYPMSSSQPGASVRKPGRVPAAVLHAADLLRWTLQANANCRPTATQALNHPLLASIELNSAALPGTVKTDAVLDSTAPESPKSRGCTASSKCNDGACALCLNAGLVNLPQPPLHNKARSGVVSECTTSAVTPEPPALIAKDLDLFKDMAMSDMYQWESEMYSRLGHSSASGQSNDHMDVDGYPGHHHLRSYSSVQDEMTNFYSSSSNYDDISCYFY
ncbi:hypothetical protein IWW37_000772 [Coemansia sp. RSA 2050]|nr:hypothetical protein IWW37_000772 [Coemansia sp. RSA 2050]